MKANKALLFAIVLLLFSQQLKAQWIPTGGPYGGPIQFLAANDTDLYAGSNFGSIFHSSDKGENWKDIGNSIYFNCSDLKISGPNLYAATYNGIFLSTDKGESWKELSTIYAFCIAVKDTFLFVSTPDGGYRSNDNGLNWSSVNNGIEGVGVGDLVSSGSDLFVATYSHGIYYSSDNGASWTQVNSGLPELNVFKMAVNDTNLYAMTNSSGVFRSGDKGAHWTSIGLANLTVYSLLENDTYLYAATSNGVYYSMDNGQSWIEVNSGLPNEDVLALAMNGNHLFAGTATSGVFLSTDNGTNWEEVNNGLTNFNVSAFAVSDSNLFAAAPGGVYKSTNDHTKWEKVNNGLTNTNVTALIASGTRLIAGTNGGGIFYSDNNGANWQAIKDGLKDSEVIALGICDSIIYASTVHSWPSQKGSIYRSFDGGINWQVADTSLDVIAYHFASKGSTIFAGANIGEGGGIVMRSTDNGSNWSMVFGGSIYSGSNGLVVLDSTIFEGISGIHSRGLFRSDDDGTTWRRINTGFANENILSLAVNGPNLYAATYYDGVYVSSNKGDNWTSIGLPGFYVTALATDNKTLFVATNMGVWQLPLSQIFASVDKLPSGPNSNISLEQNYPNPFSQSTTIKFRVPQSSFVSVKVYDFQGKEVATLVNEERAPGAYEVRFDANGMSKGVYYCCLRVGDSVQTKKLLF
jgi:photosystem II stability/assembly factor-like uncharacterized protein